MTAPVITFYSYKGGVGRTFAMANIAALMARWGYRVLCLDWDLEAPGLHQYFDKHRDREPRDGLLEWVLAHRDDVRLDWREHIQTLAFPDHDVPGQLDLMQAGRFDETYVKRVQSLDWDRLYDAHGFGQSLEEARREWVESYDYVLIDSRTGLSDIGGICAAQLPDILVFLMTTNRQSLDGSIDAVRRAQKQREQLPVPRGKFLTVPLPSRFDGAEEYEQGERWLAIFAETLAPFYRPWLDAKATPRDMLDVLRVPYLSYWSFDERLAVLDERLQDAKNISYALGMLGSLLVRRLRGSLRLVEDRESYLADTPRSYHEYDFALVGTESEPDMASALADALRSVGARVWVYAQHIVPGDDLQTRVVPVLERSKVVLLLIAERWPTFEGADQLEELVRAVHGRVIPVYAGPHRRLSGVPFGLSRLAPLVIREQTPEALRTVAERLMRLVE